MPRKNPVPERELAICRRLRDFREKTKLSQVAFAQEVELDSGRLASYEHGRVPLRYWVARKICYRFNICQRWLATGVEPPVRYYVAVHGYVEDEIPKHALFSEIYDERLAPHVEDRLKDVSSVSGVSLRDNRTTRIWVNYPC